MRGRYKKWAKPYLEEHPDLVLSSIQKEDPFFQAAPLALEIGAGKGDFVLQMAQKYPETHFLALERDLSVCGIMAKKIEAAEVTNIRVMNADFDRVHDSFQGLKFQTIYLNFSDPWPKKRHEKRRLTTADRLEKMAKLLTENGEIRIKTDNDILYAFTLEQKVDKVLTMVDHQDQYVFDESTDAMSEYERNFRSQGKAIHRIVYRKIQ